MSTTIKYWAICRNPMWCRCKYYTILGYRFKNFNHLGICICGRQKKYFDHCQEHEAIWQCQHDCEYYNDLLEILIFNFFRGRGTRPPLLVLHPTRKTDVYAQYHGLYRRRKHYHKRDTDTGWRMMHLHEKSFPNPNTCAQIFFNPSWTFFTNEAR